MATVLWLEHVPAISQLPQSMGGKHHVGITQIRVSDERCQETYYALPEHDIPHEIRDQTTALRGGREVNLAELQIERIATRFCEAIVMMTS